MHGTHLRSVNRPFVMKLCVAMSFTLHDAVVKKKASNDLERPVVDGTATGRYAGLSYGGLSAGSGVEYSNCGGRQGRIMRLGMHMGP